MTNKNMDHNPLRSSDKNRRIIAFFLINYSALISSAMFFLYYYFNYENYKNVEIALGVIVVLITMDLIYYKKTKNLELSATISSALIGILLIILVWLHAQDYTILWPLLFGFGVFMLNGYKKGLIYVSIFYLFIYYILWLNIGIGIERVDFFRYIAVSFVFSFISYFYDKNTEQTNKTLQDYIDKIKNLNSEYKKQLYLDGLTGLKNFFSFEEDVRSTKLPVAVVIDIDRFRSLNSIYSFEVGNLILKEFGKFLLDWSSDKKYSVYRIYGDEFALLSDAGEHLNINKYEKDIFELKEKIDRLNINIKGVDEIIDVDATLGISIAQENSIQAATTALSKAKKLHKDFLSYTTFIDDLQELKNSKEWAVKIKHSIANNQVLAVYQPIVDRDKNIIKYEVLMRILEFNHDEYTLASPNEFLEVAIATRQYHKLFSLLLDQVIIDASRNDKLFSINISFSDMHDILFVNMLEEKLSNKEDLTNRLVFEILESENIENIETLKAFIEKFKALGIRIAIDDFGTGYSNFSNVLLIKPDYIKIDGSLIKDINSNTNSKAMVNSIIFFSKEFKAKVISEYIHSKEVFEIARKLGVDEFQGYYFSPPVENIEKLEREYSDKKDNL